MITRHKAVSKTRLAGGVLVSAVAFGLATAALGTAGSANASCVSIGGINSGGDCKSAPGSVAIALGAKAQANAADGPMNIAVAVGNPGPSTFYGPATPTQALAKGSFNSAFAIGGTNAGSLGNANSAIAVGNGSNAYSYGGSKITNPSHLSDYKPSNFNTSIVLGNNSEAVAVGPSRNLATAFGDHKRALTTSLKP